MRYALLICTDESALAAASPEEAAEMMKAYDAFGAEMGARGVLRGGERLRPTSTGAPDRRVGLMTEGPAAPAWEGSRRPCR